MAQRYAALVILIVAASLGAYAGIRAHSRAKTPAAASAPVEPPVPAPAGLVAEAVAVSPDVTWRKAQAAAGGVVLLLPPTFGEMLASVARVPALAHVVDGGSPAYGVLGEGGRWVVAARAVSPQAARSTLESDPTTGLRVDSHVGEMDVLAAVDGWLGLAGSWVVVGSDREAVRTLGPYAYRTLPTRPLPKSAVAGTVGHAALAGPIRALLEKRWQSADAFLLGKDDEQRRLHGGRAPDLADPKAVVAELDAIEKAYAERLFAMERADVAIDVEDDGAHARITLHPPLGGPVKDWVDGLEPGGTAPLLRASQDALATIFWRSDDRERRRAAKEAGATLSSALGARVPAADEAKLGAILERIAVARSGWALASVTGGAQTGGFLRVAASDPAVIAAAFAESVDLAKSPGWAKWERDALGVTKIERDGARADFTTEKGGFQASWVQRADEVDLGVGVDAKAVLASASAQITLASDAKVSSWLRALRRDAVWVVVARPLLIASSPRSDPVVVALLRGHEGVILDVHAPGVVVREMISREEL